MTYDTTGKRIRTENLAGQATTTAWDCCHKVSETRPDGSVTTWDYADGKGPAYDYDANGRLTKRTWARGIDTFYSYDGWGNLTSTTYSDTTPAITLSYDALGRQIRAIDAAGTTTFAYDVIGSLTNEAVVGVAGTNILERFHDTFGRDAGYALNGVRQSTLGYNLATGRLSSMAVPAEQSNNSNNRTIEQFTWSYIPGSDLKSSLAYPNGLTASWTYGNRGELLEVDNALPSGSVSKYIYTYDAAGRRVACAKSGSAFATPDTCAYRYNTRSELTNAVAAVDSAYRYGYEFDDIGNRKTSTERGTNSVYTANSLNQYTAVDDFVPQFDDDGNQTLVKTATGTWQITYNGENRPILWTCLESHNHTISNQTIVTMSYDRMGRRVAKNDQRFVYNGFLQVADNAGNVYVWDPTEPVATRPLAWRHDGETFFYTYDGNKNVSEVVASDDTLVVHYEYVHFGAATAQYGTSAVVNYWCFSSEKYDIELGLVSYATRFYNSKTARWIERDFAGEGAGVNLYAFLSNDPVANTDYLGYMMVANGERLRCERAGGEYSNGKCCCGENSFLPSHYCCRSSIVGKSLFLRTGVVWANRHSWHFSPDDIMYKQFNMRDHVWLTWGGQSVDSNAFGDELVRMPATMFSNDNSRGTSNGVVGIILSECEYDGLTFLSCLTKTAMEDSQSKKRGGWCNAYVDGLVEKCKAEAKLAVPLK